MTGGSPGNIHDLLQNAELALAEGSFIKALRMARRANSLLDSTQEMHRKFVKTMKKLMKKVLEMEDQGYDVEKAWKLMEMARDKAKESDYELAIRAMEQVEPTLVRATYLPFPLLNRSVDIISTIVFSDGKVRYDVKIYNPTDEPLGEIVIKPPVTKDFQEIQDRYFGIVEPGKTRESTFILVPTTKDWNLGIDRKLMEDGGVVLRTQLSSRSGKASYFVTVENNTDQIIRDITVSPKAPGGLEADPPEAVMDFVEPYGQKTLDFDLHPPGSGKRAGEGGKHIEKVIVIEDNDGTEAPEDWGADSKDEKAWTSKGTNDAPGPGKYTDRPTDFEPVKEDYDLISMSPYRYPDRVEKGLKGKKEGQD